MAFLSKKQLAERTGLSPVTIWRRVRAGDFPPPRQLTPGRVGWVESDVEEWEQSRPIGIADLPANINGEPWTDAK